MIEAGYYPASYIMNIKNKKNITMNELTQGYEKFMKGKETNFGGEKSFNKVIKKASKPKKQSGSKQY